MTRHLARWELAGVGGAVVVVDVIRAFTTAAYAFASGAAEIYLFASVDEALAFKAEHPGSLAMGCGIPARSPLRIPTVEMTNSEEPISDVSAAFSCTRPSG